MSRHKRRKVKASIQGRKLKGHAEVRSLGQGTFSYRGYVFDIEDFPPRATINLDATGVEPVAVLPEWAQQPKEKKKKKKKWSKDGSAALYSNKGNCQDVQAILQTFH